MDFSLQFPLPSVQLYVLRLSFSSLFRVRAGGAAPAATARAGAISGEIINYDAMKPTIEPKCYFRNG